MNMDDREDNIKGNISLISPNVVEWKVPDFFSTPLYPFYRLESPPFTYLDGTWCLQCLPNGHLMKNLFSPNEIYLYLKREHSVFNHIFTCQLGIRGKEEFQISGAPNGDFQCDGVVRGICLFVTRIYLYENKDIFSPDGGVTFFCTFPSIPNKDEASQTIQSEDTWQARISRMYNTKEHADVRFVINGRVFEAHRLVLVERSPEFCRLLAGANAAYNTHIVEDEYVTETAFEVLLRFLYTNHFQAADKKMIVETCNCAVIYRVQELQDKCKEEMESWDLSADEVCSLLEIGLNIPILKNKCMYVLRREGEAVLSSPNFLVISSRTLRFILESGTLENVPVLKRVERVLEWSVHPKTGEVDYTGVREKLLEDTRNPLLGRLHIEDLELGELSYVVDKYRGLIIPKELVRFLQYQHLRDASLLPAWCHPPSNNSS